jgi:hypothetical protein
VGMSLECDDGMHRRYEERGSLGMPRQIRLGGTDGYPVSIHCVTMKIVREKKIRRT